MCGEVTNIWYCIMSTVNYEKQMLIGGGLFFSSSVCVCVCVRVRACVKKKKKKKKKHGTDFHDL